MRALRRVLAGRALLLVNAVRRPGTRPGPEHRRALGFLPGAEQPICRKSNESGPPFSCEGRPNKYDYTTAVGQNLCNKSTKKGPIVHAKSHYTTSKKVDIIKPEQEKTQEQDSRSESGLGHGPPAQMKGVDTDGLCRTRAAWAGRDPLRANLPKTIQGIP